MYKYCQQDSINLLKMNFRKYQKLKFSLSGRFITLHKKLNFFPMLSFSYMYSVFWLLTVKMDWKNLHWSFQYEMSFPVSYATQVFTFFEEKTKFTIDCLIFYIASCPYIQRRNITFLPPSLNFCFMFLVVKHSPFFLLVSSKGHLITKVNQLSKRRHRCTAL